MLIPGIDDRLTFLVLGALLGFLLGRLAEWLMAGDQRRDAAKTVALPLLSIAKALHKHCAMIDDALVGSGESLRTYYRSVVELVPQADLDELNGHVRSTLRLPHGALADLRAAHQAASRAQGRHDQLRQTLEMSETLASEGAANRRLILSARQSVRGGLQHIQELGPVDTRRAIADFIRKTS